MAIEPTPQAAADPSMEDILASIRRILADGEGEVAEGESGEHGPGEEHGDAAQPTPHAVTGHPASRQAVDDVFMLDQTMLIEDSETMPTAPPPQAAPEPDAPHDYSHLDAGELPPAPLLDAPPLLNAAAAAAAAASLGALARAVGPRTQLYRAGPTLEDMLREELRPLVKSWLDEHLPPLVERLVRQEIDRVTTQK